MAVKKDSRIDTYIKGAPEFSRPIFRHLRKLVHETCPKVEETMKWDSPWFLYQEKVLCGLVYFKAHCSFLFNNAKSMRNMHGLNGKVAQGHMRKLTTMNDLPSDAVLKSHIKKAMKLNEPGAKIERTPKIKKRPVKLPADLKLALLSNPKALSVYEGFIETTKRHYVEWIEDAKTEATREKRLEKAVECLEAGKTRHWL